MSFISNSYRNGIWKKIGCSRRFFISGLLCSLPALLISGCKQNPKTKSRLIRLGTLASIQNGKNVFDVERLAVLRYGADLRCVSLVCTHQDCLLSSTETGFQCPCHGSTFSPEGKVQSGPASKDLYWYKLSVQEGKLFVDLGQKVDANWRLRL